MAAEVRQAGEADPAKLAVATIVAAQLATLVGPPSARVAHTRGSRGRLSPATSHVFEPCVTGLRESPHG